MRAGKKSYLLTTLTICIAMTAVQAQNFSMQGYATVNADGVATTTALDPANTVKSTVQKNAGFGSSNPQVAVHDKPGPFASGEVPTRMSQYALMNVSGLARKKSIEAYDLNGKRITAAVLGRSGNMEHVYIVRQAEFGFSK